MTSAAVWHATVRVRPPGGTTARWLLEVLAPEAAREVPRARATLREVSDGALELAVEAADAGAMRAAINTYLGWIDLALATLTASRRPS